MYAHSMQIPARHFSSDISASEEDNVYALLSLRTPTVKLLYVTPEKVSTFFFLSFTRTHLSCVYNNYHIKCSWEQAKSCYQLCEDCLTGIC